MAYPTLPQIFLTSHDRAPAARAVMYKAGEKWESFTWQEFLRRTAGLARALAELGVRSGDRVALFSANRPEWHIADFAIQALGAAVVPIYFNEAAERIAYIVNDSGAKVVIAVGEMQARRMLGCRELLQGVGHIILAAAPSSAWAEALHYETLIAAANPSDVEHFHRRAAEVKPEQLATIIYTSGTTGVPKGVMLTQMNLASNTIDSATDFEYMPNDIALSFLPLAHVYERTVDYGYFYHGVVVAYVESMDQLPAAFREVQPTIAAAVPRVFEKMYANILARERQVTGFRRKIYGWAMRVAKASIPWRGYGKRAPLALKLQWHIADRLAYSKIRQALGGRIRALISGSAPLSIELLEFFWSVGVRVYQGYGLTETSPIVSVNTPSANRLGSAGKLIPNVHARIAADGEILIRGPLIMRGYYNKPRETDEVLSADGWLRTGDIGHMDEDGYLYITDRKKDLLKTAAGKYIAPQPIENLLKTSPYIQNAVIIADRQRFVSALIVPDFSSVEAKAAEAGIQFSSPAELAAHPWVRELMGDEIKRLTPHLAQFESIKRFALLDHDFTFEAGQLTYSMKVKRHVIAERYRDLITQLYGPDEELRPVQN
jgi:long-chain acyl-CoA synthetase